MTRLYLHGRWPDFKTDRILAADFDGEDAPLLAAGSSHGHGPDEEVTLVDFGTRTYRVTKCISGTVESRPFPRRWLGFARPVRMDEEPVLVVHDGDSETRVRFAPEQIPS